MNYLITGCCSLVGRNLIKHLSHWDPQALFYLYSTSLEDTVNIFGELPCMIFSDFDQLKHLSDFSLDYVIHLGEDTPLLNESMDQESIEKLLNTSCRLNVALREFLETLPIKPKRCLFGSSINAYGFTYFPHDDIACLNFKTVNMLDETCFAGESNSFFNKYAQQKETFAYLMRGIGIDTVVIRFGFVLDRTFEDLGKYVYLIDKLRLKAFGSGYQGFNWIHIEDAISAIMAILTCDMEKTKNHVFNLVAATAISESYNFLDFGLILSIIRKKKYYFRLPERFALYLMGQKAFQFSQGMRVYSTNLPEIGFKPKYSKLSEALVSLY